MHKTSDVDWSIPMFGSESKHGNCRLQKFGKINVHDVNNFLLCDEYNINEIY